MVEKDDHTDDRFPPQMTRGEIALLLFVLMAVAVAAGVVAVLVFDRP
jgi:hypothetical protein